MLLPEEARTRAANLVIGLVNRGQEGLAVALANRLKCFLGIPESQPVEGITMNGDFYQVAVRDKVTGKSALYALGPDGNAWGWMEGEWALLPPHHFLVGLAKIPEFEKPALNG